MISPQELGTKPETIAFSLDLTDVSLILAALDMVRHEAPCPKHHEWCKGTVTVDNELSGFICSDCADLFVLKNNADYLYKRLEHKWRQR